MDCDLTTLDNQDKLTKTVDYLAVYNTVRDIFNKNKFYLIETVNNKICDVLLEKFPHTVKVTQLKVCAAKSHVAVLDCCMVGNVNWVAK